MKNKRIYVILLLTLVLNFRTHSAATLEEALEEQSQTSTMDPVEEVITAAHKGNISRLKDFIALKIDPNLVGSLGNTALIIASKWGHTDAAKLLIEAKADVNIANYQGETALSWASSSGNDDIAALLVSAGASFDIGDNDRETPLILACRRGFKDIVKMAIDNKANLNAVDIFGSTALIWAIIHGHKDIIELLLASGADLDVTDKDGKKAIQHLAKPHAWDTEQKKKSKEDIAKLIKAETKKRQEIAIGKRIEAVDNIVGQYLLPVLSNIIAKYSVFNYEDVPEGERK